MNKNKPAKTVNGNKDVTLKTSATKIKTILLFHRNFNVTMGLSKENKTNRMQLVSLKIRRSWMCL